MDTLTQAHSTMYGHDQAAAVYRNFLAWLFATFGEDEAQFRRGLINRLRLQPGQHLLITGCGLGDDVLAVLDAMGSQCRITATDLSDHMVQATREALRTRPSHEQACVQVQVADACALPHGPGSFDAAFHFGGINLFDTPRAGIHEMARVVREGGRVVFGDEGVAPWLTHTEHGRMAVANNPLWAAQAPLAELPACATEVMLSWVLGNCFYMIEFVPRAAGAYMNPDIAHLGYKGGSMRSRFEGQVEGIAPELKQRLYAHAKASGRSVHELLNEAVAQALK